jgi:creatinine amidohydrolase
VSLLRLGELTWPDAARIRDEGAAIGLVAVGALEQHGPHLPMSMDSVHVTALAEAVAERLPVPVVVPPTLQVGLSDHHLGFPGTVTVGEGVLGGLVEAHLEAFERIGIRRVALVSGHGGNFEFLGRLAAGWTRGRVVAYDALMRFVEVTFAAARELGIDPPETDIHAGFMETSIALTLYEPGLVKPFADLHGYLAAEPGWLERVVSEGLHAVTENGVLGDPALSTEEAGRAMFEALVAELTAWVTASLEL